MNKLLSLLLSAALLATSCSKGGDSGTEEPTPVTPTVLLTKITNVTPGVDNGKVVAEFLYNGKQLVKANLDRQANGTFAEAHTFSYNAQGLTTGATISSGQYGFKRSDVTYNGNNLASVSFTRYDNTVESSTFTYESNRVALWKLTYNSAATVDIAYSYDGNGHNTRRVEKENLSGNIKTYTYTNNTFDTKSNLSSSLPLWAYFRAYMISGVTDALGTNNPLTGNEDGPNSNYIYTYDSNGYPTKVTSIIGTKESSFAYEYTTVN